jgi:hypothetical protein
MGRYLDLYRRVRIGPSVTLLFENRQTLWFRIQEILSVARLSEPLRVQEELDIYNQLLPGRLRLQAALIFQSEDEATKRATAQNWQGLQGNHVKFHIGPHDFPATLITARPEDMAIGLSHWMQFTLGAHGQKCLRDLHLPATLEMAHPRYQHESLPLSDEIRQSLLDDLNLAEKDGGGE